MTDPALAQLLTRLVGVAAIALLVRWEARVDAVGKLMAGVAPHRLPLALHLLGVHMIFMREPLDAKLAHLRGEADPRSLRVNRRRVADYTHLARRVGEILGVTINAGPVPRKACRHAVIYTLMAEPAILRLGLMFGPRVIERRFALDNHRLFHVERRLVGICIRLRRRRRRGRRVGGRLLGAAAGNHGDEKNRCQNNDC